MRKSILFGNGLNKKKRLITRGHSCMVHVPAPSVLQSTSHSSGNNDINCKRIDKWLCPLRPTVCLWLMSLYFSLLLQVQPRLGLQPHRPSSSHWWLLVYTLHHMINRNLRNNKSKGINNETRPVATSHNTLEFKNTLQIVFVSETNVGFQ